MLKQSRKSIGGNPRGAIFLSSPPRGLIKQPISYEKWQIDWMNLLNAERSEANAKIKMESTKNEVMQIKIDKLQKKIKHRENLFAELESDCKHHVKKIEKLKKRLNQKRILQLNRVSKNTGTQTENCMRDWATQTENRMSDGATQTENLVNDLTQTDSCIESRQNNSPNHLDHENNQSISQAEPRTEERQILPSHCLDHTYSQPIQMLIEPRPDMQTDEPGKRMTDSRIAKQTKKYNCEHCGFETSKKSSFDDHRNEYCVEKVDKDTKCPVF